MTTNNENPAASDLSASAGYPLPKTPPDALLHSMAIRYDHALGCDGYYDTWPDAEEGEHERRYQAAITTMRQLYEEVSGYGFFSWDNTKIGGCEPSSND